MKEFQDFLRRELKTRGLTQEELAKQMGYAQSSISHVFEDGAKGVKTLFVLRLSVVTGVSADVLLRLLHPGAAPELEYDTLDSVLLELIKQLPKEKRKELEGIVRVMLSSDRLA